MLLGGKIKLRDIKELQGEDVIIQKNALTTPLRKRKNPKSASTSKKIKEQECSSETVIEGPTTTLKKTSRKKLLKSALKETPSNQKRIDSFFASCPKTYDIKFPKEENPTSFVKSKAQPARTKTRGARNTSTKKKCTTSSRRSKTRRKRLFTDSTEPSTENMSVSTSMKTTTKIGAVECITIDSDSSEEEDKIKKEIASSPEGKDTVENTSAAGCVTKIKQSIASDNSITSLKRTSPITASSLSFGQIMSKTSCDNTNSSKTPTDTSSFSRRKTKPCPLYKVIENTSFAVDAFQFGYIENITHYFLTHFHADHYIGLTKTFAMPLYMSPITARLVRKFIPVQEQYIHELELNQPCIVNDMEVTALEANHCPGAILIVFKFLDSGKCILHTGDFRACHEMESEPVFWNNHIHTIYLDTTYISDKYAFCTQYESIMKAEDLIDKFIEKHAGKRILYICGTYIVGKEKFWSSLAEKYEMKVWAEGNRYKALKAMDEERFNRLLVTDPNDADMHVIPMGKLSYLELVEYFKLYEHQYDIVFAIRPSGWEKDTKPRYGAKINIIGIEYSEHSSYAEMKRFVKFLKPEQVISTVPRARDLMKTNTIPDNWYKYDTLKAYTNYQPSLYSFLAKTPNINASIRLPNANKGGVEYFVSPLKPTAQKQIEIAEEINGRNKRECRAQNYAKLNLQKSQNITWTTKKTTTMSTTNSSEDFEKSDFIIKTKKMLRLKQNLQEKAKSNNLTQTKRQRNKKQLTPKNIKLNLNTTNSEECFETPEVKPNKKNKSKIENKAVTYKVMRTNEKTAICNGAQHSSEDELYELKSETLTPANTTIKEQNVEMATSQKRMTRSKSVLTKSTNASSGPQTDIKPSNQHNKKINSKSELATRKSHKKRIYKTHCKSNSTIDSTSTDEWQAIDLTIEEQSLEIPTSQKRMTRSKSASTKITNISSSSPNKDEKEFESKLVVLTEQNDKIINSTSKLKTTTNCNGSQENPIFNSSTDSTGNPASADEMKSLKPKEIRTNLTTTGEDWLDKFEYKIEAVTNKRHALNHSLRSLKKTKSSIDFKTILNTILEQSEDIDRFNCSQLAGLVVKTVNEQNPDYSKDHIPAELLSDADDDWM